MKLLLYCTKARPILRKLNKYFLSSHTDNYYWKKGQTVPYKVNGKIVAECDFEVEEIFGISRGTNQPDKYDFKWEDRILKGACLTNEQMNDYIPNYAIHIKNLHIFDNPRELYDCLIHPKIEPKYYGCEHLSKAPQNMMYVELDDIKYVLISIQTQWLCKILNGEKTIEVRKKVLKEMLE